MRIYGLIPLYATTQDLPTMSNLFICLPILEGWFCITSLAAGWFCITSLAAGWSDQQNQLSAQIRIRSKPVKTVFIYIIIFLAHIWRGGGGLRCCYMASYIIALVISYSKFTIFAISNKIYTIFCSFDLEMFKGWEL